MAQMILELLGMASGATPPPGDGRQSLTSYEPTMRDKLANWLLGETPSQTKKDFVQGLVGSRGMGATGMGLVDFTPAGVSMQSQEGYRERGLQGAAMPFIGGPAGKVARKFGDSTDHALGQISSALDEMAAYHVKQGKSYIVHDATSSQPLIKFDNESAANNFIKEYTGGGPKLQANEKEAAFADPELWQRPSVKPKEDLSVTEGQIKSSLDKWNPFNEMAKSKPAPGLEPVDQTKSWIYPEDMVFSGGKWMQKAGLPNTSKLAGASDSEVLSDLMKNVNSKKAEAPASAKAPVWDYEQDSDGKFHVFDAVTGKTHSVVNSESQAKNMIDAIGGPSPAPPMKLDPAPYPKSVDPVKQMLTPGDLKKVEDRYQQAIAPLKINFPPRALEQGYETPAFRGMKIYGKDEPNPVYKFDSDKYDQMYSTDNPMLADMYSDYKLHHPGWDVKAGDFGEGAQVSPLLLNTKDYHYYDAQGGDWRKHNSRAMDEARKLGKPGVIVDNVRDEPNSTENLPSPSKVFITFPSGASTAKSRFAERFDPTSPNMLHGIPVGAMIGSGLIMGQDGRPHKIEHMPEGYDPFASQNPENGT